MISMYRAAMKPLHGLEADDLTGDTPDIGCCLTVLDPSLPPD